MNTTNNLILIGMAGAGKSTVGALLAESLHRPFLDSDDIIRDAEGHRLHDIIAEKGVAAFRFIEEQHVLAINVTGTVVATGGSVVYSRPAMTHLKSIGTIIFLDVPVEIIEKRIGDPDKRGLVKAPGQSVTEVYTERLPLYREYADYTIDCSEATDTAVVDRILRALDLPG